MDKKRWYVKWNYSNGDYTFDGDCYVRASSFSDALHIAFSILSDCVVDLTKQGLPVKSIVNFSIEEERSEL